MLALEKHLELPQQPGAIAVHQMIWMLSLLEC